METYNCTAFATNNAIEILAKRKYGNEPNYSDRCLGILAGTYPPGNDPHIVCEALRKNGVCFESELPFDEFIPTVDQYYSPSPLTKDLVKKAEKFLFDYDFKHEWVYRDKGLPLEEKQARLMEALMYSPLNVSVMAWREKKGLYTKKKGEADTHWTTLFGYEKGKHWLVFDSYKPYVKKLAWDYDFGYAKRLYIGESTHQRKQLQIGVIIKLFLLGHIAEAWKVIKAMVGLAEEVTVVENTTKDEPKKDYIDLMAQAIQEFEGWYEGSKSWRNKNPGNIKKGDGSFMKFRTHEEGFNYLKDYLHRACTGKHKSYKPEFSLFKFVATYAPPSENSSASILNYATHIAKALDLPAETQLKELV